MNGKALGTAGPWVPYRFELPVGLLQGENTLHAHIRDIVEPFGPTPGRRFDAGIVRDLYLMRKPATFIESVSFRATLDDACTHAACEVLVELNGPVTGQLTVTLAECATAREVVSVTVAPGNPICFPVASPHLWSPDAPNLYTLTVRLLVGDSVDLVQEMVGIRRIEVRGQDFYLNNQRLLLKGVCRHEFTSAHSYAPPVEEVREELALIKHAGFNYIRLVHSPQSACVPRIAAELGLLVSEEPGTCFHNLADEAVAAPALEALRRLVRRDRNCPAVFAWYIYNECEPNIAYAQRAAALCRALDPDRLLSFADCSGKHAAVKAMLAAADLSFYGINQYTVWPQEYIDWMQHYTDRPLVFTEWGGWMLQGNPRHLKIHCDTFVRHAQPTVSPRIAGCSFWCWADYEEYSRAEPAAIDGWTVEGLLDQRARPRPDLQLLSLMCHEMEHPPQVAAPPIEILATAPQCVDRWLPLDLTAIAGDQGHLEEALAAMRARFAYRLPTFGALTLAGIDFICRDALHPAQPLLLGKGRAEVVIPVEMMVCTIAVLGHVALQGGYPSSSIYSVHHTDVEIDKALGQAAARYEFLFDDGLVMQPLQHGIHILRGNNICRWWKTAPRAPDTRPAVQAVLHPSYEVLRYDLWEHSFGAPRYLKAIRWILEDADSIQALMAISLRQG
ncbi:MAG TPA: glycoside hydrolase family 2 TIM barrel-domain containing protein [Armatimonadota bacterium]